MSAIGTVLGGKYRIVAKIGEGGMGSVYHAENVVTGKQVAVKQMHAYAATSAHAVERFVREARAAARLTHPNVLDIYDVLEAEGVPFLVMELLQGETLREYLRRNPCPKLTEFLELILPAMAGVAAAHAAGVIHRDLKPDNIFLARSSASGGPIVKVVDFGIARLAERDAARMTQAGAALGTPEYMSFEQLRGVESVDVRTDVYAFGVMLYEAMAGRLPFSAVTLPELIIKVATTEPPRLSELRPDLPARLVSIVERALARDPDQRWPNLNALSDALVRFAHEESQSPESRRVASPVAVPSDTSGTSGTWRSGETFGARELAGRRRPAGMWLVWFCACALVAMVAAVAGSIWSGISGSASTQQAVHTISSPGTTQGPLGSSVAIRSAACLIDANGDALLDVVGFSGYASKGPALILDGRDGNVLWSGGSYAINAMLFCPTRDLFVMNDDGSFVVSIRDARKPNLERTTRLDDAPDRWGFGSDCVAISTRNKQRYGISLLDGSAATCAAEVKSYPELEVSALHTRSASPPYLDHDGARYRIDVRRPGTPVLTAMARGQYTWKVELAYQDPAGRYVLAENVLAVVGRPIDGPERGLYLVGLDIASGRILYEQPLCARTLSVLSMAADGPNIVLVEGWTGVWTFQAKTGSVLWRSGTCG